MTEAHNFHNSVEKSDWFWRWKRRQQPKLLHKNRELPLKTAPPPAEEREERFTPFSYSGDSMFARIQAAMQGADQEEFIPPTSAFVQALGHPRYRSYLRVRQRNYPNLTGG